MPSEAQAFVLSNKHIPSLSTRTREGANGTSVGFFSTLLRMKIDFRPICMTIAAYFIPASVNQLRTIDDIPALVTIRPPEGMYTSAKMGKGRARGEYYPTDIHSGAPAVTGAAMPGQQYPPPPIYAPYPSPHLPSPGSSRSSASPEALRASEWSRGSPPSPLSPGRERQTVIPNPARTLPPPTLGLHPATPVQSPYSPRHPLDNEALRSLGRSI